MTEYTLFQSYNVQALPSHQIRKMIVHIEKQIDELAKKRIMLVTEMSKRGNDTESVNVNGDF